MGQVRIHQTVCRSRDICTGRVCEYEIIVAEAISGIQGQSKTGMTADAIRHGAGIAIGDRERSGKPVSVTV